MQVIKFDASNLMWCKWFNLMQVTKFDAPETGDDGSKSLLFLLFTEHRYCTATVNHGGNVLWALSNLVIFLTYLLC